MFRIVEESFLIVSEEETRDNRDRASLDENDFLRLSEDNGDLLNAFLAIFEADCARS